MERPQLRPYLTAAPEDEAGRRLVIFDQLRLSDAVVRVSPLELECVNLFDGQRSLREIQAEAVRAAGGQLLPLEMFTLPGSVARRGAVPRRPALPGAC